MTGRGIDQILPHPGDPALRENVVNDARTYVTLAERANGPIGWPVPYAWPWGDALSVLDEYAPDVRLLNLETAVTTASEFAAGKAVHYRMNPANIECLAVARPDVCVLANNHVSTSGPGGSPKRCERSIIPGSGMWAPDSISTKRSVPRLSTSRVGRGY